MRPPLFTIAGALFLLSGAIAEAHDSPTHRIESLTLTIERQGASAELYLSRAYEYIALSLWIEAIGDFRSALESEPTSAAAIYGLTQALIGSEAFSEAETAAKQGIALSTATREEMPLQALLAKSQMGQKKWTAALASWQIAIRADRPEIDWYLAEAECLFRLNRFEDRAAALQKAKERNPSVVLHRTWIQALVDAGQSETALPEIEKGLRHAGWKSSWLLLRARVYELQGRLAEQRADAERALAELARRLDTDNPDPILIQEAAKALTMLGRDNDAEKYLERLSR